MENRIVELEVGLRIAEARADLAFSLIDFLCDQLAGSGVINWTSSDLKRQYLIEKDFDIADLGMEFARLDLDESNSDDFGDAVKLHVAHTKMRMALREKIAHEITHERDPS